MMITALGLVGAAAAVAVALLVLIALSPPAKVTSDRKALAFSLAGAMVALYLAGVVAWVVSL